MTDQPNGRGMRSQPSRETELSDGSVAKLSGNQLAFLAAYAVAGTTKHAAQAAGIVPRTVRRWRTESADFRAAFADAVEEFADMIEAEARRRAVEGVRVLRTTKSGDPIRDPRKHEKDGSVKPEWEDDPWLYDCNYSDRLLELLLRAKRPAEFRDRVSQEISGPGGAPLEVDAAARQIAVANPELADHMCTALEKLLEHQQQSGADPADLAAVALL